MPRLYIGSREIKFISDITKEFVKDIVGQKIYYYPISETKTLTHNVYDEAIKKIFESPIEIDAIVDASFQNDTETSEFGVDSRFRIEVFLHYRDLVEKSINVTIGDCFSFSDIMYEIVEKNITKNIYGMAEHRNGYRIVGTKARESMFTAPIVGPTDITYTDADAVQTTFVQQRGESEIDGRPTGDVREMVKDGTLDKPLTGPREVSPRGDSSGRGTGFYDE